MTKTTAVRKSRKIDTKVETASPTIEAPAVSPTVELKGLGIGVFCKAQIAEGKTNKEVFALVKQQFPSASTSIGCIAWYRAAMKKVGQV